ncbi:MAG: aldehyde dehydrogenase family protein, partial [Hyphomicrobiales bacterium]|nr:aldehyde dehydrogenase family protein [Hyphomicrobiales bacterium]
METALNVIDGTQDIAGRMAALGRAARAAARELALAPAEAKNRALAAMAEAIRADVEGCLKANALDLAAAEQKGRPAAFLDRLTLTPERIAAMAQGLDEIAALADPVGDVIASWERPNGLRIERVRVPLGVIGIVYESRPNVTADAGGLCLKSGNAVILRGGSESHHSSSAIHRCLLAGLAAAGLPEAAIQIVPTTDREAVGLMLKGLDGAI